MLVQTDILLKGRGIRICTQPVATALMVLGYEFVVKLVPYHILWLKINLWAFVLDLVQYLVVSKQFAWSELYQLHSF